MKKKFKTVLKSEYNHRYQKILSIPKFHEFQLDKCTIPIKQKIDLSLKTFIDSIRFDTLVPDIGAAEISFTRFLEMLSRKQIKRIWLMADGRFAIVEKVIAPITDEKNETAVLADERDILRQCIMEERPEYLLDENKSRFFCELPGDVWDNAAVITYIKQTFNYVDDLGNTKISHIHRRISFDKFGNLSPEPRYSFDQTSCELVVLDPNDSNRFLADNKDVLITLLGLAFARLVIMAAYWISSKLFGGKDEFKNHMEKLTSSGAKEYNVPNSTEPSNKNISDTGVRFSDVAGIDSIRGEILDVLSMMKGEPKWQEMGVKMPSGILLSGPPGTGKTLIAKAIAGEAGIPFFAVNGAQFVEKYQGIASSRIRNLFSKARKFSSTGAIIFIDEIDALAVSRKNDGTDSANSDREQGLLQLLVEMDGFNTNGRVLVIAATNLISSLDKALMRPGRFDRIIHMGNPSKKNRLSVLKVHSRDKNFSNPSERDKLLHKVSEITPGYSCAELANILNESSILSLRKGNSVIDLPTIIEAIEKVKMGLPNRRSVNVEGKKRFALNHAAKSIAMTLSPGSPTIERVLIRPVGGRISRIITQHPTTTLANNKSLYYSTISPKRARLLLSSKASFFHVLSTALVPLYASRAFEEARYGYGGSTLGTVYEVSIAAEMANIILAYFRSQSSNEIVPWHESFEDSSQSGYGTYDTRRNFESKVSDLIESSFIEAKRLVIQRNNAIEKVAQILQNDPGEMISGDTLLDIVASEPLVDIDPQIDLQLELRRKKLSEFSSYKNCDRSLKALIGAVGEISYFFSRKPINSSLLNERTPTVIRKLNEKIENKCVTSKRIRAVHNFATMLDSPFPPPPVKTKFFGSALDETTISNIIV